MDEAIAAGVSRRRVFRMVARGDWLQFHPGIYFPLFGLQLLNTRVVPRKRRRAASICYSVDELADDKPVVDEPVVDGLGVDEVTDPKNRVDASAQEEMRKRWSDAKNRVGEESFWKANLTGRLLYGGDGSMASHRAAARLHGLEGIGGFPTDVTVPLSASHRPIGCHRSKLVDPDRTQFDGIATASLVRTLHDLAAVCPCDVVEQALESALRGPDRRRPDLWNTELLTKLRLSLSSHEYSRRSGNLLLASVLNRRSNDDRPTGSFPETLLWQALFKIGLITVRQPSLTIFDGLGNKLETYFPDLSIPKFRLIIEIDGAEGHTGEVARSRDLQRQNKLFRGFVILRFTAVDILRDPDAAAEEVRRATLRSDVFHGGWTVGEVTVKYSTNRFVVVDKTRDK
jgi:very-short-patch-repair endonuclease